MKYFTEPEGKFVIQIPTEWQYKNIAVGYEEVSPFGFELYENPIGAFQISCYSGKEISISASIKIQKTDTDNLEFIKRRMDGGGFNMHLWYAVVGDYVFIAKYIYDTVRENNPEIDEELKKAEKALSTLILVGTDRRSLAIETDKYEKFIASLSASFDLKNKAIENNSPIELLVILANQIDAYLRMALVLKKQLKENTNRIDIVLLFQGEKDPPVMERKIYSQAKDAGIIDQATYEKLEALYKERNKVIHRYIITEFKTRNLYQILYDYECVSESVRLSLKEVEDLQYKQGIGIHGNGRNPEDEPNEKDIQVLFSWVNDKHLMKDFYRQIKQ